MDTKPITFRLDADRADLLEELASEANTSRAHYVARIVAHHLETGQPEIEIEDQIPEIPYVTEEEAHEIAQERAMAVLKSELPEDALAQLEDED